MKKKKFVSFVCGALLIGATLTACSSNQSTVGIGIDQAKTVGFMQLANENKERIWFDVNDSNDDDLISKDDTVDRVFVIKNGKVDIYHTTGVELSEFKDMSDKDIVKLMKQMDKEFIDSEIEGMIQSINVSIEDEESMIKELESQDQEYNSPGASQTEIDIYKHNIQLYEERKSQFQELNYEDIKKLYSNFPITGIVETDASGNNVATESIELPSEFEFGDDATNIYSETFELLPEQYGRLNKVYYPVQGEVYQQSYKGYNVNNIFWVTTSLDDSVNLGFDTLDTKNVTEE
ncbi:TPA: hypothetical protein ACGPAJ_000370 [Streptococcus suis]